MITEYPPLALMLHDRLLLVLALAVTILVGLAAVFAVAAIFLRLRNARLAARWAALEAVWQPLVLDALTGGGAPDAVAAAVAPADAGRFVDYLMRFLQRLRGVEAQRVQALAQPHLALIERRVRDGDVEQRARAMHTLGLLAASRYAGALVDALRDPSPLVAMTAARALAATGEPRYLPELLAAMPGFALWQPRYLAALLTRGRAAAGPRLRECFSDERQPIRTRLVAAEALVMLHDFNAADAAAAVAAAPAADRELRAVALRLLAAVGTPRQHGPVADLLAESDAVLRGQAAAALGALGGADDVPRLCQLLDDESVWVALQAAKALARCGGVGELRRLAAAGHARADLFRQAEAEP